LGVKSAEISGFFTYVEHFASQMALGPCPPATVCSVLDYQSAPYKHILICNGLSKPIEFPVDEVASDTTAISNMLHTSEKCIPFVIRNLASDWPSMKKWRDIAALSREYGHRLIPVEIGNMASGMSESIVCFRHFVEEYLTASTAKEIWSVQDATSDASQIAYLAQHPLLDQIPALYSDVEQNPCGVNPTNVNVWMGTGGTRTPLHFDSYDNLLVQVVGAKYVRLYAREHTSKLYVSKNKSYGLQGNMSDLNCEMEDFEKHPKAEDCPYQEVLLLPGDCLFIPSQHWHYVRSLSTSISVNYWF
jgi:lysine-specific demethylase 8